MTLKLVTRVALFILVIGWVVGIGCHPFVRWSTFNCRYEEIDINTGQIRHRQFLLHHCITERTEDSPISRELKLAGVAPDWRRVNTFSPCVRTSPHHVFHSGIHQTITLGAIWHVAKFTPAVRKQAAEEVLRMWKTGQDNVAINEYIRALHTLAEDRNRDGPPITAAELPET